MREAIFLSASVPDAQRSPDFARTADSVAIMSAISALLFVTLGRRPLVWGGHPAITPMVWAVSSAMDVDYGAWVRLYQSERWRGQFPEDNQRFQNVVYTPELADDRAASLRLLRETMFQDHEFAAAVFIGGMDGVIEEHALVSKFHPNAELVSISSTGGAAALLNPEADIEGELDYVTFLHERLGISPREMRYRSPANQPAALEARMGRPD